MLKKERETAEKIAARAYTQRYLAGLLPAVFSSLRSHGFFYDSVQLGRSSPPVALVAAIDTFNLSSLSHSFLSVSLFLSFSLTFPFFLSLPWPVFLFFLSLFFSVFFSLFTRH